MKSLSQHSVRLSLGAALLCAACGGKTQHTQQGTPKETMQPCPTFVADSALAHIRTQCAFGPRVPGTEAWRACGDWIAEAFRQRGCTVEEQQTNVTTWDGTVIPCRNLVARLRPDNPDRILLCAHWDSRPWADNDPDPKNHRTPVPAANDGASGVALMLELARVLTQDTLPVQTGIDFVCFDAEDSGTPQWAEQTEADGETWCLGSTAWAEQAASEGYQARFGILFDMVGGRGSTFSMEGMSMHYAEPVVQLLWQTAHRLGYGHYFPMRQGGFITDDHVPVNQIAHIPCIDVVPYFVNCPESSFGPTWHTLNDTPEHIDPSVLEAVGQSVLQLIYNDNER